jgi:hypothetical protein
MRIIGAASSGFKKSANGGRQIQDIGGRRVGEKRTLQDDIAKTAHPLILMTRDFPKRVYEVFETHEKARVCEAKLMFVVTALDKLMADENFVTLLRAEALDTMPKQVWARVAELHREAA